MKILSWVFCLLLLAKTVSGQDLHSSTYRMEDIPATLLTTIHLHSTDFFNLNTDADMVQLAIKPLAVCRHVLLDYSLTWLVSLKTNVLLTQAWYVEWWAFVGYALLFVTVQWLGIRYYTKDLKEENQRLKALLNQHGNGRERAIEITPNKEEIFSNRDELVFQEESVEVKSNMLKTAFAEISKQDPTTASSISYAVRIQNAMMPDQQKIDTMLPQSFVLLRPRDVVSGDFYWVSEKDGKTIFATVDCTGHGVTGAMMSMLGNNILNEVINVRGIIEPHLMLSAIHKDMLQSLKREGSEIRDGMDIGICVLDTSTQTIEYAGANHPLWFIQEDENENLELKEIKADRKPVGGTQWEEEQTFTLHRLDVSQPTTIYMFSDGYQDQFGGANNKKFSTKRFRNLLFAIHRRPMHEQKSILNATIQEWIGSHRQTDDILVMGIKLN